MVDREKMSDTQRMMWMMMLKPDDLRDESKWRFFLQLTGYNYTKKFTLRGFIKYEFNMDYDSVDSFMYSAERTGRSDGMYRGEWLPYPGVFTYDQAVDLVWKYYEKGGYLDVVILEDQHYFGRLTWSEFLDFDEGKW